MKCCRMCLRLYIKAHLPDKLPHGRMAMQERHLKEGRKQCWGARDKYWKCLDSNNEISEKCVKFRKEYEKFCSQQWVKHFDRKRQFEKFKEQTDPENWDKPPK